MDEKMKIEGKGELRSQPWPRQFDNNPSKWFELTGQIPKREWVGLTDEDIDLYAFDEGLTDNKAPAWLVTYARGIEAKLKEKNA